MQVRIIKNLGPWSTIGYSLLIGTFVHFYVKKFLKKSWRRRVLIENICIKNEFQERKSKEARLNFLRVGDDMDNPEIEEILLKERLV